MTNEHRSNPDGPEENERTEVENCDPVSIAALRDFLDAVMPILESDESLKANLYAVGLAHELDLGRQRAK